MLRITCPEAASIGYVPSLWTIMSKVRLEAFLWGLGTALGELPPYFMARAARLSGIDPSNTDDEFKEIEELKRRQAAGEQIGLMDRVKIVMESVVERVGFFGILACASVRTVNHIWCYHLLSTFGPVVDSQSTVRSCGYHLRSFSGAFLDVLRRHRHRQGSHQDAHPKGVCDHCVQRDAHRKGTRSVGLRAGAGTQGPRTIPSIPQQPEGASSPNVV